MNFRTQPFPIRLLSAVLYLPVAIALGFLLDLIIRTAPVGRIDYYFCGITVGSWFYILLLGFPILGLLLILWRGSLRLSLILTLSPGLLAIPISAIWPSTPPSIPLEQRNIVIDNSHIPEGTEVYCNGVLLGTTPLTIRVGELQEKVAPWPTPPEQQWCNSRLRLYTWYPWDDFFQERFEAAQANPDENRIGNCRYWWRFDYQGTAICLYRATVSRVDRDRSFGDIQDYRTLSLHATVIPSRFVQRDLLLDVLDHLDENEKTLWAQYVLQHHDLLWNSLASPRKNGPSALEEMLNAVARLEYGLSPDPTPEECRQALRRMIEENKKEPFLFENIGNINAPFGGTIGWYGRAPESALRAIDQMGVAAVEPILELLREKWYGFKTYQPLFYAAQKNHDPNLFGDMVRFFATMKLDSVAVFENANHKVAPLFHTVTQKKNIAELLAFDTYSKERLLCAKLDKACEFQNPLLDPVLREILEEKLYDCTPATVSIILGSYLKSRIDQPGADLEELIRWVQSLKIKEAAEPMREFTVKSLQIHQKESLRQDSYRYPYLKGHIASLLYPDDNTHNAITFQLIENWLKNHPEKKLEDFFGEIVNNDTAMSDKIALLQILFYQQFFEKPEESAELLRKIWDDPEQRKDVLTALSRQFYSANNIMSFNLFQEGEWGKRVAAPARGETKFGAEDSQGIWLPGLYGNFSERDGSTSATLKFSEALYPILQEVTDEEICIPVARFLAFQDPPQAIEVLKKWAALDNPRIQKAANETLSELELREKIRSESKRLFLELATGKITPDDLIPKSPPWVWQDGKYVQAK